MSDAPTCSRMVQADDRHRQEEEKSLSAGRQAYCDPLFISAHCLRPTPRISWRPGRGWPSSRNDSACDAHESRPTGRFSFAGASLSRFLTSHCSYRFVYTFQGDEFIHQIWYSTNLAVHIEGDGQLRGNSNERSCLDVYVLLRRLPIDDGGASDSYLFRDK